MKMITFMFLNVVTLFMKINFLNILKDLIIVLFANADYKYD